MVQIDIIKANHGDCFLIKHNEKTILIDGGLKKTYTNHLKKMLKNVKSIDLLIITHICNDHIAGIIKLFEDQKHVGKIKKIWFNSGGIISKKYEENREFLITEKSIDKSVKQGYTLEKKISILDIWEKRTIKYGETLQLGGINIKVLAPFEENLEILNEKWEDELKRLESEKKKQEDKSGLTVEGYESIDSLIKNKETEDQSIANKSSIVILIEIDQKKLLFSGDSTAQNIVKGLKNEGYSKDNPIKLNLFKLPHHGSKNNINKELIEMIDCDKYLISTNGSYHNHPDKEALAKLIAINKDKEIELIFNYESVFERMFSKEDKEKYDKFRCKKEKEVKL